MHKRLFLSFFWRLLFVWVRWRRMRVEKTAARSLSLAALVPPKVCYKLETRERKQEMLVLMGC